MIVMPMPFFLGWQLHIVRAKAFFQICRNVGHGIHLQVFKLNQLGLAENVLGNDGMGVVVVETYKIAFLQWIAQQDFPDFALHTLQGETFLNPQR